MTPEQRAQAAADYAFVHRALERMREQSHLSAWEREMNESSEWRYWVRVFELWNRV